MRFIPLLMLLLISVSCARRDVQTRETVSAKPTDSVRKIDLPRYQVELPNAPGRDTFAVACLSCHSARYIAMQPPLSQAKWDEEVKKMVKTFGAPIGDDQVPVIVQYLMTTKEHGRAR